jgi:hypothetical protein
MSSTTPPRRGGGGVGGGTGGGGCTFLDADGSLINLDTFEVPGDLTNYFQQGSVLTVMEHSDCNGDGIVGIVPIEITATPIWDQANQVLLFNYTTSTSMGGFTPPAGFNTSVDPICAAVGKICKVQYQIAPLAGETDPALERREVTANEPWTLISVNIWNLQLQYSVGMGTRLLPMLQP